MGIFKKDKEEQNRIRLRNLLKNTQMSCPVGWEREFFVVGGLTEVGFSQQNPEMLLIVSSQGRGIIDCEKLEKIERDNDVTGEWINEQELWCLGLGETENEKIRIAGLHGGGLPFSNKEGDNIEFFAPNWPIVNLIFQPNFLSIYKESETSKCFNILNDYEPRAYGFSPNGQVFITATGGDVIVYRKEKTA